MAERLETRLAIVGAGPGGYPAAFLAADLGVPTTIIDPEPAPGGVCLLRGCIPSKALLHVAHLGDQAREAGRLGLKLGEPAYDLDRLRAWKNEVVGHLTGNLAQVMDRKGIRRLRGRGRFLDAHRLEVTLVEGGQVEVAFQSAIIATGSVAALPRGLAVESDFRLDSRSALELPEVPRTLLVVGGGYIGLELGSVYASLGSKVTVVEMTPSLLPGVDRDLVSVMRRRLDGRLAEILVRTRVDEMRARKDGIEAVLVGKEGEPSRRRFERVLVAVGRRPNTAGLNLQSTGVELDERGFIRVDERRRTAEPHLLAIGDVAGEPMLAHKATAEGKVAAENVAGLATAYDPRAVPAVVYTDPEIAWCGLTENQAREAGRKVRTVKVPWRSSGRALTMGRDDGMTKLVVDPDGERLLGVGLVGPGAGELIAEAVLAIEMGASAADLRLIQHPHPTLSETLGEAAQALYDPRRARERPPGR